MTLRVNKSLFYCPSFECVTNTKNLSFRLLKLLLFAVGAIFISKDIKIFNHVPLSFCATFWWTLIVSDHFCSSLKYQETTSSTQLNIFQHSRKHHIFTIPPLPTPLSLSPSFLSPFFSFAPFFLPTYITLLGRLFFSMEPRTQNLCVWHNYLFHCENQNFDIYLLNLIHQITGAIFFCHKYVVNQIRSISRWNCSLHSIRWVSNAKQLMKKEMIEVLLKLLGL